MPQLNPLQDPYETWTDKAKRKFDENPWVPLGCLATTGALVMSAIKMRQGKSKHMNYWLRARVALQGVTIVALYYGATTLRDARKKKEELELAETGSTSEQKKKDQEKKAFESRLEEARQATEQEEAAGVKGVQVVAGPAVKTARREEEERKKQAAKAEPAPQAPSPPTVASSPAESTTSAIKKSSSWKFWSKKDSSD